MQQAERSQYAPLRRFTYSRRGYEITEVDRFVNEVGRQLGAAQQRIQLLETQLDQLSHENEALTQMINHVARLGEQMVADARQEAHNILSGARSEAQERVIVARADARTLVSEERRKVADELEMLAVVRETVVRERDALLSFHSDLNGRLREIVTSIVHYSNDDQIHELAAIGGIISPELAPSRSGSAPALAADGADLAYPVDTDDDVAEIAYADDEVTEGDTDVDDQTIDDDVEEAEVVHGASGPANATNAVPPAPVIPGRYSNFDSPELQSDEKFDRAFSSFMGNDQAAEPSRDWLINGE